MIASTERLTHAALLHGVTYAELPPRMKRAAVRLLEAGTLSISTAPAAVPGAAATTPEPEVVPVPAKLTPAERAKAYRERKRAAGVTAERDGVRDGVRDDERDESRDESDGEAVTSDVTPRVLSLSSPLDSGSSLKSPESPLVEVLGDQFAGEREGARDAGAGGDVTSRMFERDATRDAYCCQLRRLYANRYEKQWKDLCPPMAGVDEHVRRVVAWAVGTPDPTAAMERFIDGAFTPAKWRKGTCRSPWRFIAEDPGATAAYSTQPSPTVHDAKRPPLPRQELPPDPAEAGGAF